MQQALKERTCITVGKAINSNQLVCTADMWIASRMESFSCTNNLKIYLENQEVIHKEYPTYRTKNSRLSDWDFLEEAMHSFHTSDSKKILKTLASSSFHRLRYKSHYEQGKKFVEDLLTQYSQLKLDNLEILWELKLDGNIIQNYLKHFQELCKESERKKESSIYRLYDLLEGRDQIDFESRDLLALLFAFSHGLSKKPNYGLNLPKSLSELVGKYEFYITFNNYVYSKFRKSLKDKSQEKSTEAAMLREKFLLPGGINKIVRLETNKYLSTVPSLEEAQKIWIEYYNATFDLLPFKKTLPTKNFAIEWKDHKEFDKDLSDILNKAGASKTWNANNPFPLNFFSYIEAIYHPYKHRKVVEKLNLGTMDSPKQVMIGYLEAIRFIILNSKKKATQPHQFNEDGTIFKYQYEHEDSTFRVLINSVSGVNTYTLTCL